MIHDRIGWHKSSEVFIKEKRDTKKENSRPDRDLMWLYDESQCFIRVCSLLVVLICIPLLTNDAEYL